MENIKMWIWTLKFHFTKFFGYYFNLFSVKFPRCTSVSRKKGFILKGFRGKAKQMESKGILEEGIRIRILIH